MNDVSDSLDYVSAVNRSQIAELKKAGAELNPVADHARFGKHVGNVQAAVIHTYQLTAWRAIRKSDPKEAALLWKEMADLCDEALIVLNEFKAVYPNCGTPELYDLALDYRNEAQKRYFQNLEDSECPTMPVGLFPQMT
jgi:hypothetical protein